MIDKKVDYKVNIIGLVYMVLAYFGNGYARFACFSLFIAVIILLKNEVERLVLENKKLSER